MQEDRQRRSNEERSRQTRAALVAAARALFVERGYGETGTPEIVETAGLTRGALYHHFADKQALFAAVVEAEAQAVAAEIEAAAGADPDPLRALAEGGRAFLAAMTAPGRTRLLLLDAPAVLGRETLREIEARHAMRTLREGLEAAIAAGAIPALPITPLIEALGALFDRAALAIGTGDAPEDWHAVIDALVAGLAA